MYTFIKGQGWVEEQDLRTISYDEYRAQNLLNYRCVLCGEVSGYHQITRGDANPMSCLKTGVPGQFKCTNTLNPPARSLPGVCS